MNYIQEAKKLVPKIIVDLLCNDFKRLIYENLNNQAKYYNGLTNKYIQLKYLENKLKKIRSTLLSNFSHILSIGSHYNGYRIKLLIEFIEYDPHELDNILNTVYHLTNMTTSYTTEDVYTVSYTITNSKLEDLSIKVKKQMVEKLNNMNPLSSDVDVWHMAKVLTEKLL